MCRAELRWEDLAGNARHAAAIIEDRSSSGLAIRVRKSIPIGTTVNIKYGNQELGGTIKRCNREGFEYIVGIRLGVDPALGGQVSSPK